MRLFGQALALKSPLAGVHTGFESVLGSDGVASHVFGCFLCLSGWSEPARFCGGSATRRWFRSELRVSRFISRSRLDAAQRNVRPGSSCFGVGKSAARISEMAEDALSRRFGMTRASFSILPQRPVRTVRGFAPNGVLAARIDRTAQSFPPCASLAKRCDFPVPRSFAEIRADEVRAQCRKFL